MKWLCIIASLWVIVLSTTPCCADQDCADDVITQQTEQQEEKCADCSPFFLCGDCTGFTLTIVYFVLPLPVRENPQVITPFTITRATNGFVKVWQPPKMG